MTRRSTIGCRGVLQILGRPLNDRLPRNATSASNIFTKFRWGHPWGGAKYRWGIKILRFSTNKLLYLVIDTRQCHSYYRRQIRNCTQAFEWHRFQWSWVTSKPDFKFTILFNVKKLENGTRQSYIYNGQPIESRIWSIKRRHFQWLERPVTWFQLSR